jgi:hypothetical protein
MTNLMKDHMRLVNAYRAPSTDTSELLSNDIPPP